MEPRLPFGERFDLAAYARAWKEVGRMERAQGQERDLDPARTDHLADHLLQSGNGR